MLSKTIKKQQQQQQQKNKSTKEKKPHKIGSSTCEISNSSNLDMKNVTKIS